MTIKKNLIIPAIILAAVLFNTCRQPQQLTKRYYVIEIPTESLIENLDSIATINKFCEVRPVTIFPPFATQRIAIREDTHEINYFRNHEWAIRPSDNFTIIIVDFLEKYKIFKGTSRRYWKIVPDFQLETMIYQLQVIEQNKKISAHLNLEFRLLDNKNDEIIFTHSADNTRELEKNNINLFAMAISEMFYAELFNFTKLLTAEIR